MFNRDNRVGTKLACATTERSGHEVRELNGNAAYDNVIDLAEARQRLRRRSISRARANGHDQRLHTRHPREDRLFVQVISSPDNPNLVGNTLSCTATDMSVGGMQFEASTPLPPGTLLDLWVDIRSRPGKFFLAGEVRWVASSVDGIWRLGVELRDGAATDIIEWIDYQADYEAR